VAGAAQAIDYYRRALGAVEIERHARPDGAIVHAELAIGAAGFTVKDEDATDPAPTSAGGTPVLLMLAVDDVDAVARDMVAAGGTVVFPVGDSPAGRGGRLADPFGHLWMISQAEPAAPGDADADLGRLADLQTPWCLHVAATLRVPEHVAAGRTTAAELAAAADCDAYALDCVLGHLVTKGVFTQPAPGRYALNDAARQLLEPARFLDLSGVGGRMAHAWSTLPGYVKTGRPHYHEVFGLPFWEDLAAHPEVGASFDALMGPAGHGTPDPHVELADGWDRVRTVVDVGGGTGAMLAELLRARPALAGTLVDLPGTVTRAAETFAAAGVSERVTVVGQSFFDPLPPGADLYLLTKVLNDWPDEETVAILRRCAEAARPGDGRIVIMGGVSPDGTARRLTIEMVLVGGRTNTVTEFTELARRADLKVVAAGPQPSGRFVVECRPA
jgi:2,7-dihydroxy-5-methyl-1-naphthoate 7-O-methyltransferase